MSERQRYESDAIKVSCAGGAGSGSNSISPSLKKKRDKKQWTVYLRVQRPHFSAIRAANLKAI